MKKTRMLQLSTSDGKKSICEQLYSQFIQMDKGTPKSYRSTAQKSKILNSIPLFFDQDIQIEKEYLEKLKAQRIKAEKLYHQYTIVTKERDRLRRQKEEFTVQIEHLKNKYRNVSDQNRLEVGRLKNLIEQLESENKALKSEKKQNQQYRSMYGKKIKQLETQIQIYQSATFSNQSIIQNLEAQIQSLENQNRKLSQKKQYEISTLFQKNQKLQKNYQQLLKQNSCQKQVYLKQKKTFQQERDKAYQTLNLKIQQINTIKLQFQSQTKDKDRNYQLIFGELQDSKKFWAIKFDQKNRQMSNLRKSCDNFKEQCKKLRSQTDSLRQKIRDQQQKQSGLQTSLFELTKIFTRKQTDYKQIQDKYQKLIQDFHRLEIRTKELEQTLKSSERESNMLSENCEQYMRIIKKKEFIEQERMEIFETQYEEIQKMEQIFSKFQ